MKVLWVAQWYGGWFRNPNANHIGCFLTPCKLRGCTTNLNWWVNPGVLVAINSGYFKKTWGKMLGKPLGCFFSLNPINPIYTKKYHVESGFFLLGAYIRATQKKKKLLLSIEPWLVNRDPYSGLWNNPCITGVVFHPLYNPTNQGPIFRAYISFFWRNPTQGFTHPAPPAANVLLLAFRVLHAPDPQKCRKHPRNPGGSPGSLTARPWKNDVELVSGSPLCCMFSGLPVGFCWGNTSFLWLPKHPLLSLIHDSVLKWRAFTEKPMRPHPALGKQKDKTCL